MSPLPPSPLPARSAATGRQPVRAGVPGFCSSPVVWQHGPVVRDPASPAKGTACLWRRFRAAGAGGRCPHPHFVFFIRRSSFRIHSMESGSVTSSLPTGEAAQGDMPPRPRFVSFFSPKDPYTHEDEPGQVHESLLRCRFEKAKPSGGERPWPHRKLSLLIFDRISTKKKNAT